MARPNARSRLKELFPERSNQVYIVPTAFGIVYALGLLLMLLMAYTYQNNLAYLMTFFLTSFGFSVMFSTHRFVQGARLEPKPHPLYEEGDKISPPFRPISPAEAPTAARLRPSSAVLTEHDGFWTIRRRGWHEVTSVRLQSRFPLGLFQAWKRVPTRLTIIAAPKAVDHGVPLRGVGNDLDSEPAPSAANADELRGLVEAREGLAPSAIDWKAFARGRGLLSKEFESPASGRSVLDWESTKVLSSVDHRLEQMCYWIRGAKRARRTVEVRLPDGTTTFSADEALRTLARWEPS